MKTLRRIEAYVIYPTGGFRHVYPANGLHFEITELINLVGGGLDVIPLSGDYSGKVLIMARNEYGKKLKLKLNRIATRMSGVSIHGDALVCERHLLNQKVEA